MTIRNIDGVLEDELRARAARHGRSMEDEARDILKATLAPAEGEKGEHFLTSIRRRVEQIGGIDIELPERSPPRDPIDFRE